MPNKDKRDKSKKKRIDLEKHPEQKFVDDIPVEELTIEMEDEKNKKKSKDSSSSEPKETESE